MLLLKKWWLILIILLIVSLIFLFWPLKSSDFEIVTDNRTLAEKEYYLKSPVNEPSGTKPNIILITVDDLGMADCSLYGEGDIKTPNIEKLASQGVVFDNAYVTSPVCAPSRAAIITGRYQHRFGFEFTMHERYLRNRFEYLGFRYLVNSDPWEAFWMNEVPNSDAIDQQGLPLSEVTLAEVLKKYGYNTGIVGKWHLGWGKDRLPSEFGFDEQYGFINSHSLYAPEGTAGIVGQKIDGDWTDPYIWSGQRNGPHAIYRNNVEIEEEEYLTDRITEESIRYIDSHRDDPFFLWVSYNAPHTPLQAPKDYVDKFMDIEDPVKRIYRAMIASLDDALGRLLNHIDKTGTGENTLIFFISDNGGAEYTLTTDNGLYDGGKNTEFEGGVKVPMIMRWNGKISDSLRFEPMVSSMDIFATCLEATNAEMMPGREIDGIDLMPFIKDSTLRPPHEYLLWQRGISKVVRNNEWKLVMNDYSGDRILYNLKDNKYEDRNLILAFPDVADKLEKIYGVWKQTHAPPMWPSVIYFTTMKDGKKYYFEQ